MLYAVPEFAIPGAYGIDPMKGVPTAIHMYVPERSAPYATPFTALNSVVLEPTTGVQSIPFDEYASEFVAASAPATQ